MGNFPYKVGDEFPLDLNPIDIPVGLKIRWNNPNFRQYIYTYALRRFVRTNGGFGYPPNEDYTITILELPPYSSEEAKDKILYEVEKLNKE